MKRRTLLAGLCATISARALPGHGQTPAPRVSLLTHSKDAAAATRIQSFRDRMKALGYEERRNVLIEVHRGEELSRVATDRIVAEVIATKPEVIVTGGYAARAAAARTKSIPIVSAYSGDIVDAGLITSLAHPGGNVTGVQLMALELAGKRIELLKELLPNLRLVGVIADPGHAGEHRERDVSLKAAARLGITISYHPARNFEEYDGALAAARGAGVEALLLFPDTVTNNRAAPTAVFALQYKLPTVAGWDNYAEDGQLISYGPSLRVTWARLAYFVDRILKGADPGTLPVELPTIVEMVVNLKTARALGLKIPQSVQLRADRMIE